jgi:hypothetical protein
MVAPPSSPAERRLQGRVPFVRRCALAFADGRRGQATIVNINTVGAYVGHEDLAGAASLEPPPKVGDLVTCRFGLPDRADEAELQAIVTWVNARQPHPVHSLPPGFGLTFRKLSPRVLAAIEQVMADAASRSTAP